MTSLHRFITAAAIAGVLSIGALKSAAEGAAAGAPASGKLKVFLLAGQSNMEGKGDGAKLTAEDRAELARARTHVLLAYNGEPPLPLHFRPADAGLRKKFGSGPKVFGPEIFFGLRMAEAWPNDKILLIKRAVGGTSLYGRWNPDWSKEKAAVFHEEKQPPLYPDFIGYVRHILAAYPRDSYQICGMLWVQGEQDSAVKRYGPLPAAKYGANLRNLIQRVRQDIGVPDLPFLMVQVGSGKVVAGMQNAAATMPNVVLIQRSMDPASPHYFPQYPAGHYNYEGQKRIGSVLAEAYLKRFADRSSKDSLR